MIVKKKFLRLGIREQVSKTLLFMSLLVTFFIIGLFGSFSYDFLNYIYRQRKEYFYNIKKCSVLANINFQSFILTFYTSISHYMLSIIVIYFRDLDHMYRRKTTYFGNSTGTLEHLKNYTINKNASMYYFPFVNGTPSEEKLSKLSELKEVFEKNVFLSDRWLKDLDNFHVPIFGKEKILNEYVFYGYNFKVVFGRNAEVINNITADNKNDSERYIKFFNDVDKIVQNKVLYLYHQYVKGRANYLDLFYHQHLTDLQNAKKNPEYRIEKNLLEGLYKWFFHIPYVNFSNDKIFIFDKLKENEDASYSIYNTFREKNLEYLLWQLSKYTDLISIPVDHENKTLISGLPCYFYILKQIAILKRDKKLKDYDSENKLNDLYSSIINKTLNINECILTDKSTSFYSKYLKDFIETNSFADYFSKENSFSNILTKIYKLDSEFAEYYAMFKYTYPDFKSLYEFDPSFIVINQFNFYSFANFYDIKLYLRRVKHVTDHTFFFIVICLLLFWVFIIILLQIFAKHISNNITQPIEDLQNSVERMDFADESIFNYKDDETIDELFKTTKELLQGQLTIQNHKKLSEKNNMKYKSNLIFDNQIIEEKADDFSNEESTENNIKLFLANKKGILSKKIISKEKIRMKKASIKEPVLRRTSSINLIDTTLIENEDEVNEEKKLYGYEILGDLYSYYEDYKLKMIKKNREFSEINENNDKNVIYKCKCIYNFWFNELKKSKIIFSERDQELIERSKLNNAKKKENYIHKLNFLRLRGSTHKSKG